MPALIGGLYLLVGYPFFPCCLHLRILYLRNCSCQEVIIMSSMKSSANILCLQTYLINGCKWKGIFQMLSTSFVTTMHRNFPFYIQSIHLVWAIPEATSSLEDSTWLYVRAGIGLWCGWHFYHMSLLEPKILIHCSRTQSSFPSDLGMILYLTTSILSGLTLFLPQLSTHLPHAGVFLELEVFNSNQPLPEFFCQFHVPVWYP